MGKQREPYPVSYYASLSVVFLFERMWQHAFRMTQTVRSRSSKHPTVRVIWNSSALSAPSAPFELLIIRRKIRIDFVRTFRTCKQKMAAVPSAVSTWRMLFGRAIWRSSHFITYSARVSFNFVVVCDATPVQLHVESVRTRYNMVWCVRCFFY